MFQSEKSMTLDYASLFHWYGHLSGVSAKYLSFYISEDEVVVYRFFSISAFNFPAIVWMKIPIKISLKNFLFAFFWLFSDRKLQNLLHGYAEGCGWFRRCFSNRFDSNFCLCHDDFFKKIKTYFEGLARTDNWSNRCRFNA